MIFKALFEIKDSAVTLSPALAKYMIRQSRRGRPSLKVMTFFYKGHCYLDINPPYSDLDKEYQETLNEIQFIPDTKETGFALDNPNVARLFKEYGIITPACYTKKSTLFIKTENIGKRKVYKILHSHNKIINNIYNIMAHLSAWWLRFAD